MFVSTQLDCAPGKAWAEVLKPSLLERVIHPLARVASADPGGFPPLWSEGSTYRCKSYVFGFLPIGTRTIYMERIDGSSHEIQSRESDPLIRRWDHLISIRDDGAGRTVYSDAVEIEAGIFTFGVWLWASWFYRHRQKRWRGLANRL